MQAKRGELAKAMVEAGLNGGTLAKRVGCGPMTISRMRRGGEVDRKTAFAVCGALGARLEDLFTEDEGDEIEPAGGVA